jgi:hypothetical protein
MTMLVPSLTLNLFLLIVALPLGSAFDRDSCFQKIQYLLGNQSLSPTSPFFFRDTFGGPPYNGVDNMTLTLDGCNKFCGPKQTWYTDVGPRLTIWLIPILLLLANVELSPLDKRNFLAVLHLLGDPIDSIWSLLHKLDAWDRCSALAARCNNACPSCQRVIASVFAGYEEVQGPRIESERYFETFLQQRNPATQFNRRAQPHYTRLSILYVSARLRLRPRGWRRAARSSGRPYCYGCAALLARARYPHQQCRR